MKAFALGSVATLALILLASCEPDTGAVDSISTDEQNTSYETVGGIEDFSHAGVKRVARRIVIPLGRSRLDVEMTLRRAASDLLEETNARAISIYAYRPEDDPSGQYSVGRAVLAPHGDWSQAAERGPMQTRVDLNELYFRQMEESIIIGDTVKLVSRQGDPIELSREYGVWYEEDIIARAEPGTLATIIEQRSEPMGDRDFVRYRIRTLDSHESVGWIHEFNLEGQ